MKQHKKNRRATSVSTRRTSATKVIRNKNGTTLWRTGSFYLVTTVVIFGSFSFVQSNPLVLIVAPSLLSIIILATLRYDNKISQETFGVLFRPFTQVWMRLTSSFLKKWASSKLPDNAIDEPKRCTCQKDLSDDV